MIQCQYCGYYYSCYSGHVCGGLSYYYGVPTTVNTPTTYAQAPPYKCPVCEGRGTMPCGFYERLQITDNTASNECRSCKGTGIIR